MVIWLIIMIAGCRSRRTGAELILSAWHGRKRNGTGLWTGIHIQQQQLRLYYLIHQGPDVKKILGKT